MTIWNTYSEEHLQSVAEFFKIGDSLPMPYNRFTHEPLMTVEHLEELTRKVKANEKIMNLVRRRNNPFYLRKSLLGRVRYTSA